MTADIQSMAAQLLADLLEDVRKCTTREDHVRMTARANEARQLLVLIENENTSAGS